MTMTIGELRRVLENYKEHDSKPVQFMSCESGGFWPRGKDAMVIGTDHQINLVAAGCPSKVWCLQIDLLKEKE